MGNPVLHFEIGGVDSASLSEFYGNLFGWQTTLHEPTGYNMVDTQSEGAGIGGGIMKSPMDTPFVTFYVGVDDLQAALDKAEALGGKTFAPPMDIPEGPSIALFQDPEGNVVGVVTGM